MEQPRPEAPRTEQPPRTEQQPRPEQRSQQMPRPERREPRTRHVPPVNPRQGRDASGGRQLPPPPPHGQSSAPRPTQQASGTYQVPPTPRDHSSGPRPMPQPSSAMPSPPRPARPPANGRAPQQSTQLPIPPGQASAQLPIPAAPADIRPPQPSTQLPAPPTADRGNPNVPPALKRPAPDRPAQDRPAMPAERLTTDRPAPPERPVPLERAERPVPPPRDIDPISMTTEMEAISEGVQNIRRVDATLARFSAVHDELAEEERIKKEKRERLMPWLKGEGEDDEEPDVLAEHQAGTFDQELADLPTVLVRPAGADDDEDEDVPASATVLSKPVAKAHQQRKLMRYGRITAAALAGVLLVGTGAVWGGKAWIDGQFKKVDSLDQNSSDIKEGAKQFGDENFLMVGSDTREGAAAEDGVGDAKNTPGARSDTIMIAHIPKDRKRVVMVSFPRDLEITRPACDKYDSASSSYPGGKTTPQKNAKLNTAFQFGGPKCLTQVIQSITGLRINHFVGIDFNGFKGMVDAVDGVTVCAERPMYDLELKTWIVEKPGQNVELKGDAALNFVRARHVRISPTSKEGDPTSDYGRIKRQQRFLSSLLRKAMSSQVLLDVGKLSSFVGAFTKATFGEGIDTDQLITLGGSLQNVGAGRVTFITVPTVGLPNERGNEVLKDKDTQNLFGAIINETPLPGEQADPGPQAQAQPPPPESLQQAGTAQLVDPKTVKVQVLNAGGKDGKAKLVATDLGKQGFQVLRTDSSAERVQKTEVRYGDDEGAAATLAAAIPGSVLKKDPSLGGAVVLLLGADFDNGKVVAPKAGGTTPPPNNGQPPASEVPKGLSTVNAGDTTCA
ncbi:MAG: LCP family protein [Kibdelosporangium sp.]